MPFLPEPIAQAPMTKKAFPAPELVLLLSVALWGGSFLISRIAMRQVGPLPFTSVRFLIATVAIAALTRPALARVSRTELRGGLAIGAAMLGGYTLQAEGLRTLTSGQSAFISALYVPIVPILQILVLRRAPPRIVWFGVALATMGMVLLAQPSAHAPLRGDAFTLAASIAIAAEITLAGMFAPRADPRRLAVLQCAVVGCTALALTLLTGARLPPPGLWLACAGGLGLLSAYLQITANWAMRTIPASRAVLIFALEPVFAALFGEAAGERMNAEAMAGAALILTALAANAMAARGRRIEGTPDTRKSLGGDRRIRRSPKPRLP
jgi:drug/metabolite transporter (DMT)-like permease